MIKKQLDVAKENDKDKLLACCMQHKETCKDWLKFLKDENNYVWTISNKEIGEFKKNKITEMIKDLEEAIKYYEDRFL